MGIYEKRYIYKICIMCPNNFVHHNPICLHPQCVVKLVLPLQTGQGASGSSLSEDFCLIKVSNQFGTTDKLCFMFNILFFQFLKIRFCRCGVINWRIHHHFDLCCELKDEFKFERYLLCESRRFIQAIYNPRLSKNRIPKITGRYKQSGRKLKTLYFMWW